MPPSTWSTNNRHRRLPGNGTVTSTSGPASCCGFYDGLTVDETAARLDRRPATVKHLQYRAVRSLANAFATYV